MKKNRKPGYNGAIRAGIDKNGGYNAGGNINIKEGKFNFFVSANYNHRKTISPGTIDRLTFISDPEYQLHEVDSNVANSHFAFGRIGMDYFLDNRNTFTISGTLVNGMSTPTTNSGITTDSLYKSGYSNSSFTQRYSNTTTDFKNKSGMLSFKQTSQDPGRMDGQCELYTGNYEQVSIRLLLSLMLPVVVRYQASINNKQILPETMNI